jgi:hypothetical protein
MEESRMRSEDDSVYSRVAETVQESIRSTCPTCHRGAAGLPTPDLDDLEAIITIRDGFNKHRRDFTPAMAERFRRLDSIVSYLHVLIEGTNG